MNSQPLTYRTLKAPTSAVLHKEKKSKFYGYAFPVNGKQEVKNHIAYLRDKHSDAGHFCYAYRLGPTGEKYYVNDDGEPNNSAGMPIYGQLQAFELTHVLVVVARVYGGVKLGVGGLINAYRTAAQMALDSSDIIIVDLVEQFEISFQYDQMGPVMRIVSKYDLKIQKQILEQDCILMVNVKSKYTNQVLSELKAVYPVQVKKIS